MKGFIAPALLGVLLASPVAAQIAGSGQPTPEAVAQLEKIRKTPPKPRSSPDAVPKLSGAPGGANRASAMKIVDVRAAKGLAGTSGIRVFRGSRVSVVRSGVRKLQKTSSTERPPEPDEIGPYRGEPSRDLYGLWYRPGRTA